MIERSSPAFGGGYYSLFELLHNDLIYHLKLDAENNIVSIVAFIFINQMNNKPGELDANLGP